MGEAQASGPTENKPQILYPGDGGRWQDAPDCGDLSEDEPTLQSLDFGKIREALEKDNLTKEEALSMRAKLLKEYSGT